MAAGTNGRIKAVYPGNKFEYWVLVTAATDVYPSNGRGGATATEGSAVWTNALGLTDGDFIARITRVRFTDFSVATTITVTERSGSANVIIDTPGTATGLIAADHEMNIPMRDGFSATLGGATASAFVFFEVVQFSTATNVKL